MDEKCCCGMNPVVDHLLFVIRPDVGPEVKELESVKYCEDCISALMWDTMADHHEGAVRMVSMTNMRRV